MQKCKFCPELDIGRYHSQLTEEKKTDLAAWADTVFKRAVQNQVFQASEFKQMHGEMCSI
jgi:hypothetical protein